MTATAGLRYHPVPDARPPLEVEPPASRPSRAHRAGPQPVQGVLSLVMSPAESDSRPEDEDDFGPRPTASADLPDPARWAPGLVQVLVEVVAGHRPVSQLLRWTTPEVLGVVREHTAAPLPPGTRRPRHRPRVRSVRVCEPADGVAEVCAVVSGRYRTQALAMRLEGRDGRWRVTALETP